MPSTFQLIALVVTGMAAWAMLYRRLKRVLFPPSAVDEFGPPSGDRVRVQQAELIVRRAVRAARWPMMSVVFVAALVSSRLSSQLLSALVLGGGFVLGASWHMYAMRRWWQWAVQQGADLFLVEELAEDATLVWRHDSWWGRRQRRTWMQLPPGTEAHGVGEHH